MQEDLYINLIYKRLSGEISPQEAQQLDAWVSASDENQQTLGNITTAWKAAGDLKVDTAVNLDQEFAFLEERIEGEENLPKPSATVKKLAPTARRPKKYGWQIAAGILFLITGVFLLRNASFLSTHDQMVQVKTEDQKQLVQLPDGSKITLNKQSTLSYPENLSGEKRSVMLDGEAFFEVSHDPEKPFVVSFRSQQVEVLGTSFNINASSTQSTIALVTGKILWTGQNDKKIELRPGMVINQHHTTGELTKSSFGASSKAYWQNQTLKFDETPLKYVLLDLEEIFKVKLSLSSADLRDCRLTSDFKQATLPSILETIALLFGMEIVEVDAKTYHLNGGACH